MGTGSVLVKSFAMAASAVFVLVACNEDGKKGEGRKDPAHRSSAERGDALDSASQGTGYGGLGAGTGGAGDPDRTEASDLDTDFVRSFHGTPGSDWGFKPGTGLYYFPEPGLAGTGSDSQSQVKPADAHKAAEQDKTKVRDLSDSAKDIRRD